MMETKPIWDEPQAVAYNERDFILKALERREIAKYIKDGMHVLDVGCGNGRTAIELMRTYDIDVSGIDASAEMINRAWLAYEDIKDLRGFGTFIHQDVLNLDLAVAQEIDLAYTQQAIQNLLTWEDQKRAIRNILALLKPGGTFLMVESSQEGLDSLNELRALVDLPAIESPWHNRYIRDAELTDLAITLAREGEYHLADEGDFTSGYYLISRVINAWLAAQEGKEPSYDAIINQLTLKLPSIGYYGQTRLWIWQRSQ